MAKHYSPTRRDAYRANEVKRAEIKGSRKVARQNKVARRQFEGGN